MSRKNWIIAAMLIFVTGFLTGKEFPATGFYICTGAIFLYIVTGLRKLLSTVLNFGRSGARRRVRSFMTLVMTILLVSALISGAIDYFPVLAIFAIDYMMSEKNAAQYK